ncbi:MAG TPA: hypothetical protein VHN74_02445 [Candidatus Angelobacter sp.]|jgi:hypothetical protein|nr:hypothetical protein [Candidatus Angelobacter sp.]
MSAKRFCTLIVCFALLFSLGAAAQKDRDPDKRDLRGISPMRHKYITTVLAGAALGAGLGFVLPGQKTPLKLMLMGSGGGSTWYLMTHQNALGPMRPWALIGGNTALGWGIGWLGCNCRDGAYAGMLIGGGATAGWEALKNDRAARNSLHRARNDVTRQKDNQSAANQSDTNSDGDNPED